MTTSDPTTPTSVRGTAVITGASSGIGAATATQLSEAGFHVVLGARRIERLTEVAEGCTGPTTTLALDVTDDVSVAAFCAAIENCSVLVNNAGGALGQDPIAVADLDQWRTMYDTNLLGTLRLTRGLLTQLEASGNGHVVVVSSIAAIETYPGGAGYNAAKHAQHAFCEALRAETVDTCVQVSEVQPGLVETEFSLVRYDGDTSRAAQVYEGLDPLTAADVADVIGFIVTRPPHVNIATTLVLPAAQATATRVHRVGSDR